MNAKAGRASLAIIALTAPIWVGAAEPDAENERSVAERVHAAIQLAAASSTPQSRNPGASEVSERIHVWLLVEDQPWVRYYLMTALMRLGHKRDDSFLLELAQDCDPTFRRMAALTSMDCYDDDLNREQISGYAFEDVWWVRSALLEAMRFRSDDESLELLHHALLRDPVRDVRAAAARTLAWREDERSIPALQQAMRAGDLIGLDSPLVTLSAIGSDEVIPMLLEASESPYAADRATAAEGLEGFDSPECVQAAMRLAHDDDPAVAGAAVLALRSMLSAEEAAALLPTEESEESDEDEAEIGTPQFVGPIRPDEEIDDSPYAAAAREVVPSDGTDAVDGWEDAPFERNGGTRFRLSRGTRVAVWTAAIYEGETWLQGRDSSYDAILWVREDDLRRLNPKEILPQGSGL